MKFNVKEILDFFDNKKDSHKGDMNSIIAMLGEDLNVSVYKHFRKNKVKILDNPDIPVTTGTNKGKRLDRWILDKKNNKLFQCEIKNWSASAIGGKKLKSDAKNIDIKKISFLYYWNREISNNLSKKYNHPNIVTKVLLTMCKPKEYNILKVEPLLIYWMPITSDKNGLKPLSIISIKSLCLPIISDFSNLYIFSVSLYLRQIYKRGEGQKIIDLDIPRFKHRMMLLNRFKK